MGGATGRDYAENNRKLDVNNERNLGLWPTDKRAQNGPNSTEDEQASELPQQHTPKRARVSVRARCDFPTVSAELFNCTSLHEFICIY